ncbi:amino acid ABC transporter permease [Mycobacterium sp. 852013-50091_SCH5140682]|uniref:amino acid ABC transporter permease n=1 Tax=Mycobacterium sp. 852013-50091_SCH5140682 TaxID=1834109 RepID=UPI000A6F12DB|nr:amino acid ABC transporter permease [Mycobacterium sp. 852013-50091_SCH5140682]
MALHSEVPNAPPRIGLTEDDFTVHRRRRPMRTTVSVSLCLAAIWVVYAAATNSRFEWPVVGQYIFDNRILDGLWTTLVLTVESSVIGIVLGALIAIMRVSPIPALAVPAWLFAVFFRGTPLLVQIIFWYNLAALYPTLALSIPGVGTIFSGSSNELITPAVAGLLALGLNEGAYMSEIIRAGIVGVDKGQTEAGKALGMRPRRVLRRIVLPQAMRIIIPPMGNEIIGLLKGTSLVSVISVSELLFSAQIIYSQNLETIPLLIVVSIWYLLATTVMSIGQYYLERHYGRGSGHQNPTFSQVWRDALRRTHAKTTTAGAVS